MIQTVDAYIKKYGLLQPYDKVIVGFSGGADSVALLHILKLLNYSCLAAHCNFHLRGEESNQDETFARQKAIELNIPFRKVDFDTIGYASREHVSIEMAARELRYKWFEELQIAHKAQAIAVAHHQDDSVETIIMNLIRGTGIRGLCGIRPKNGKIIRPLLGISKEDILEWLTLQNLTYQTDSSNLSDEYTRNYIRLNVLPLLEKLNPSVKKTISRTADHLADVETIYLEFIHNESKYIVENKQCINILKLMQSPSPQTILYEIIKPYGFTRALSDSIYKSLDGESGKIFCAPISGYQIVKDRDFLLLTLRIKKDDKVYSINENETIEIPIRLKIQKEILAPIFQIQKKKVIAYLDYDKLKFPLILRTWQKGDWFIPYGMKGRKKISDYFTDRKFSHIQKDKTWLLCNGSDIIWIVGERVDERYKIDKSTKYVLIVTFFV